MEICKDAKGLWYIVEIRPGGPADMARLSVGDEIIAIDFDSLNVIVPVVQFVISMPPKFHMSDTFRSGA